jgi:tetratricopeptide (TPR) repeat protein
MPDTARVLPFRPRVTRYPLGQEEALRFAEDFLSSEGGDASDTKPKLLSEPDVLFVVTKLLRERVEQNPIGVFERSTILYSWIVGRPEIGLFDEREYLLGELALVAAKSGRLLGRFVEAERWLDLSEAGFRHVVDPAPSLAGVAFERLAVRFATGRYGDILDILPSLSLSFRKLGMESELAKCDYLEAMTLKALGKYEDAWSVLCKLEMASVVRGNPSLYGQVLVHMGDHQVRLGAFETAADTYERALPMVLASGRPVTVAELKWAIGDSYRAQKALAKALEAYRAAREDYDQLGSRAFSAQLRLVTSDVLLAMNRPREAEWEILAALPVIDEEKLLPEGFAAIALLRESVNQRKTDRDALRQVRERIQAKV